MTVLSPEEFKEILQRLTENDPSLTSLNLRGSNIGDAGAEKIAQALTNNKVLKSLNLGCNKIGDAGAEKIAQALASSETLTSLNLEYNYIDYAGAEKIAQALANNKVLIDLNLSHNHIGLAEVELIAQALAINDVLEELDLSYNTIKDDGAEKIAQGIASNKALTFLDLGNNQIGNSGAEKLAQALATNEVLMYLQLSHNQIENAGAEKLAQALEPNKVLINMSLGYNKIDVKFEKPIHALTQRNKALQQSNNTTQTSILSTPSELKQYQVLEVQLETISQQNEVILKEQEGIKRQQETIKEQLAQNLIQKELPDANVVALQDKQEALEQSQKMLTSKQEEAAAEVVRNQEKITILETKLDAHENKTCNLESLLQEKLGKKEFEDLGIKNTPLPDWIQDMEISQKQFDSLEAIEGFEFKDLLTSSEFEKKFEEVKTELDKMESKIKNFTSDKDEKYQLLNDKFSLILQNPASVSARKLKMDPSSDKEYERYCNQKFIKNDPNLAQVSNIIESNLHREYTLAQVLTTNKVKSSDGKLAIATKVAGIFLNMLPAGEMVSSGVNYVSESHGEKSKVDRRDNMLKLFLTHSSNEVDGVLSDITSGIVLTLERNIQEIAQGNKVTGKKSFKILSSNNNEEPLNKCANDLFERARENILSGKSMDDSKDENWLKLTPEQKQGRIIEQVVKGATKRDLVMLNLSKDVIDKLHETLDKETPSNVASSQQSQNSILDELLRRMTLMEKKFVEQEKTIKFQGDKIESQGNKIESQGREIKSLKAQAKDEKPNESPSTIAGGTSKIKGTLEQSNSSHSYV